jgi:hypothetical protein
MSLSVARALGAGVGVVRRNPAAVGLWLVAYFLVAAPGLSIWWLAGPEYIELMRGLLGNAGRIDPNVTAAFAAKSGSISNISLLLDLVFYAVIGAAMFRAVIRPDERGFGFVRFGLAEVSIGAVLVICWLATIALVIVLTLISVVPAVLIGIGSVSSHVAFSVIAAILGLILAAWLFVRLALAMPMIVDDGRFHLFEGWRLSGPVQGRLSLLALTIFAIFMAVGLVTAMLYAGVLAAMVGASGLGWGGYFAQPSTTLAHDVVPIITGLAVLSVSITVPLHAICAAAWADAYLQIRGDNTDEVFA